MTKITQPADEVLPKNLRRDPESNVFLYDDEAALAIVLEDTRDGDAWANEQNWANNWSNSYGLYQSPTTVSCFDGGNPFTASVPNYTVSNTCSALVPKIMGGLFYETPYFLLRPRPGTSQDTVDYKTALFAYQFEEMDFESQTELFLDQKCLIGISVMKWGWQKEKKTVKKYVSKAEPTRVKDANGLITHTIHTEDSDAFDIEYEEVEISRPWIKYCDRRTVIVNRGHRLPDISKAKFVVYRDYATFEDLNNLRGYEGYTIPSEDELKDFFMRERMTPGGDPLPVTLPESMRGWLQTALPRNYKDSADPLQNGMEILERWDRNSVIVVLRHGDDNILIRNEENPYRKIRGGKNAIPFLSSNWRNIPDCFDGQGIGILNGSNQMVSQGITDMSLSLLSYDLNPTAIRAAGFNTPNQDLVWGDGGILEIDAGPSGDVRKAFSFLEYPKIPAEAMQWLMQQMSEANLSSGANEQVTMGAGAPGIKSLGMRSAAGANLIGAANASRLDGPTGRFVRQVFIPWLQIMDELNNDRLPTSTLRDVLNKKMAKQVEVDHIAFRSAEMSYEVLAGSKLGPKKEMAQFFPFMIQLINNPTFVTLCNLAGYKFNVVAAFKAFADFAGWKYTQDFLELMQPDEQAKADAQLPSAIQAQKAKAAQQLQAQKFQAEQQNQSEEQLGKATNEVLRTTFEHGLSANEEEQPFGGEEGL